MSFDPTQYSEGLIAGIEQMLKSAYDQGVQDGIQRIVAAATAPHIGNDSRTAGGARPAGPTDPSVLLPAVARRAPRGLVPQIVACMLRDKPGQIIAEYEQMIHLYDNRVSEKSIGNELRRYEGKKYRRNDNGEWFPISGNDEAADSHTNDTSAAPFDL